MRALAVLACLAALAIAATAPAEVRQPKPTWLQRKVTELRAERVTLRGQLKNLRGIVRRGIRTPASITSWGATPLERAFLCIHGYEGAWDDPNSPYWGGLQMDGSFMRSYGREFFDAWGSADNWPVSVQMAVAIRAYLSGRGFYPWPNTARYCGLIG